MTSSCLPSGLNSQPRARHERLIADLHEHESACQANRADDATGIPPPRAAPPGLTHRREYRQRCPRATPGETIPELLDRRPEQDAHDCRADETAEQPEVEQTAVQVDRERSTVVFFRHAEQVVELFGCDVRLVRPQRSRHDE